MTHAAGNDQVAAAGRWPTAWTAEKQRQAIESLLAGRYEWDEFTRKSVVSPLLLKIGDGERASGQIGRRVDLYFVAYRYARVSSRRSQVAGTVESGSGGRHGSWREAESRSCPSTNSAKRGLTDSQRANDPRWVAVEATLLGKVQLNLDDAKCENAVG